MKTYYKEVAITQCSNDEYQIGEANGDRWDDVGDLLDTMSEAIAESGSRLRKDKSISGKIHDETCLEMVLSYIDDIGEIKFIGIRKFEE